MYFHNEKFLTTLSPTLGIYIRKREIKKTRKHALVEQNAQSFKKKGTL